MKENIELLLDEAVKEYGNKLKTLDSEHFLFDWISGGEENDPHLRVTRQLKEAYLKKDITAFDKIPLACDGPKGIGGWNTISFSFSLAIYYDRKKDYMPLPFGNETAGDMSRLYVYDLVGCLEKESKPTKFYKKLKKADKELCNLRNKVMKEIIFFR